MTSFVLVALVAQLGENNPATGARVTVNEVYRFATDYLEIDYIFWGTEEPYYSREILPYLRNLRTRAR